MRAEIGVIHHLRDHIAFTGDGSDHFRFPDATPAKVTALAGMFVFLFAANKRLIDLDLAHELFPLRILHRRAESHALIPSRVIVVQMLRAVHHAMELKRRDYIFEVSIK